jgi:hypothetical protein
MYEHHSEPIIPLKKFIQRFLGHFSLTIILLLISLSIGIIGYHLTEDLSFLDSTLNASMILGGMGPVDILRTNGGKIFASFYALFSGIIFLAAMGIMIIPVAHRILHRLHQSSDKK